MLYTCGTVQLRRIFPGSIQEGFNSDIGMAIHFVGASEDAIGDPWMYTQLLCSDTERYFAVGFSLCVCCPLHCSLSIFSFRTHCCFQMPPFILSGFRRGRDALKYGFWQQHQNCYNAGSMPGSRVGGEDRRPMQYSGDHDSRRHGTSQNRRFWITSCLTIAASSLQELCGV